METKALISEMVHYIEYQICQPSKLWNIGFCSNHSSFLCMNAHLSACQKILGSLESLNQMLCVHMSINFLLKKVAHVIGQITANSTPTCQFNSSMQVKYVPSLSVSSSFIIMDFFYFTNGSNYRGLQYYPIGVYFLQTIFLNELPRKPRGRGEARSTRGP